jgi:AhpD family alkylhydroperoxidase
LKEETRKYLVEEMGRIHETYETLDRYEPELADALVALRRVAIYESSSKGGSAERSSSSSSSVIPPKYKELIMIAVEAATGRGEKGKSHARKAIRAGATPKEVQEALGICIYLVGMSSWVDGGYECVLAAEDEESKVKRGEKFTWSADPR